MSLRPLVFAAVFGAACVLPAVASEKTAVLELFTSQGCSSCPPADALLRELSGHPGVIALSRPITYWDELGWKDTLARPQNTQKQKEYAWAMGRQGIYTPQLVVDGSYEGTGSDRGLVESMIARALAEPDAASIVAEPMGNGGYRITVDGAASASVSLVSYQPEAHVVIESGENEGREITYTNAVYDETVLGQTSQGHNVYETGALPSAADGRELRWAVVVQEGASGPILGGLLLPPG